MALSSPYRSEPVGMVSANWFVNAAAVIRTTCSPLDLLEQLHTIEARHGRNRQSGLQGYQDRTLDLDLLLFDDLRITSGKLILPHPRLRERLFVLAPLAEIASDIIDPDTGLSIEALLALGHDTLHNQQVAKFSWPD